TRLVTFDHSLPAPTVPRCPHVADLARLTTLSVTQTIHPSIPHGSLLPLHIRLSPGTYPRRTPSTTVGCTQGPRPGLSPAPSPSPPSGALVKRQTGA
ncbi:unnamed protein product, partial [Staurois parvus]